MLAGVLMPCFKLNKKTLYSSSVFSLRCLMANLAVATSGMCGPLLYVSLAKFSPNHFLEILLKRFLKMPVFRAQLHHLYVKFKLKSGSGPEGRKFKSCHLDQSAKALTV